MRPLLLLIIICLSGCAVVPVGGLQVPNDARIGLISLIKESPKHVHVGTTIFQNNERALSSKWEVLEETRDYLSRKLPKGMSLIDITPTKELLESETLEDVGWDSFTLKADLVDDFKELASTHNVSAIIILKEFSVSVEVNSPVQAKGFGIFTRCILGMCRAEVLDNLGVSVYSTNPPELVGWGQYVEKNTIIVEKMQDDPSKLSSETVLKAKDYFIRILEKDIDSALMTSGLLKKNGS